METYKYHYKIIETQKETKAENESETWLKWSYLSLRSLPVSLSSFGDCGINPHIIWQET